MADGRRAPWLLLCLVTGWLGLICSQESQLEILEPSERAVDVLAGHPFHMSCYVKSKPVGKFVEFLFETFSLAKDTIVVDPDRFDVEQPGRDVFRLTVKSVGLCDQGNYHCLIRLTNDAVDSATVRLRVIYRPTILFEETSSDVTADEGTDLSLVCVASGLPAPVVRWSRVDQTPIADVAGVVELNNSRQEVDVGEICSNPFNYNNQYLTSQGRSEASLRAIGSSTEGLYKCRAETQFGHDQRTVRIKVRFGPVVTARQSVKRQAIGYEQELFCDVSMNPVGSDGPSVWWTKDGRRLTDDSSRFKVTTQELAANRYSTRLLLLRLRPADFGRYVCHAVGGPNNQLRSATVDLEKSSSPTSSDSTARVRSSVGPPARFSVRWPFLLASVLLRLLS